MCWPRCGDVGPHNRACANLGVSLLAITQLLTIRLNRTQPFPRPRWSCHTHPQHPTSDCVKSLTAYICSIYLCVGIWLQRAGYGLLCTREH